MREIKEEPMDVDVETQPRDHQSTVYPEVESKAEIDMNAPSVSKSSKKRKQKCNFERFQNISTRPDFYIPAPEQNAKLQELTRPHIESFNWFLAKGLRLGARNIQPLEFELGGAKIKIGYRDASLKGTCPTGGKFKSDMIMGDLKSKCAYPSEARMTCRSYTGTLTVGLSLDVAGTTTLPERKMGDIPIMLKSDACILSKLGPKGFIKHKEDAEEIGGYFVVNGSEKVIRMLVQQRRNFPIAIERQTWKKNPEFTEFGVSMRCVDLDGSICSNLLHYTKSQRIVCELIYNKQQFFIPIGLLLRALVEYTDYEMFSRIVVNDANAEKSEMLCNVAETLMVQNQSLGIYKPLDALNMLGETFRFVLGVPDWHEDADVGKLFVKKCIAIHLKDNQDKFNFLALGVRKLVSFVTGECAPESLDSPSNMEVLTSGHLFALVIKDRLEAWLSNFQETCKKVYEMKKHKLDVDKIVSEAMTRTGDITSAVLNFLATGNITSKSSLGLMQASGMCVLAEKINFYRFMSHFRAVHRGSYFLTSRLSTVRKLQPESWGFICPVHTPDGAPCGLLNHLPVNTKISVDEILDFDWGPILSQLNAIDASRAPKWSQFYEILFNGKVIGYCKRKDGYKISNAIRMMKFDESSEIRKTVEVAFLPFTMSGCQYPGIYIFSHQCRIIRPVFNFEANDVEMIGNLEQVYMDIALEDQYDLEGFTHREIANNTILSFLANLTPFSECNPSPRNIYQCQMAKQTMGFSSYTLDSRSDNKMYILQTPQSPLTRSRVYEEFKCDEFPLGTNAIVAVIAYTGYDMEDSMILNKSSVERGFMNAHLRKTYVIDLIDDKHSNDYIFGCGNDDFVAKGFLDKDGLPPVGRVLRQGEPMYSCLDTRTQEYHVKKVEFAESAQVLSVRAVEHDKSNRWQKACIQLRITRNPIIGDKNASRAGQKGICSRLYAVEDMPFTEGGMVPDIIFNPHGFPSRMTIGMMIELLANKHAAVSGNFHESSTFKYSEEHPAINVFGKLLVERGFNFNGLETMYSGVSGEQLEAAIFFGPIYYQRLRHMVSDKIQGRTTGPIDPVTEQPVKGRSRGGGIRVGEMERDGFLSHGAAYVTMDRLLECSDKTYMPVCMLCGRTLGTEFIRMFNDDDMWYLRKWRCRVCDSSGATDPNNTKTSSSVMSKGIPRKHQNQGTIAQVAVPAVMKYLISELAACNISMRFNLSKKYKDDYVLR